MLNTETNTIASFQSCALGQPGMGSIVSSVEAAFCFPVPLYVQGAHVLESLGQSRPLPLNFGKLGDVAAPLENTFLEEPFSFRVVTLSSFLALWVLPTSSYPHRLDPSVQPCVSTAELSHPPYSSLGESRVGTRERPPEQRVRPPVPQRDPAPCVWTAASPGSMEGVDSALPLNSVFHPMGREGAFPRTSGSTSFQLRREQNSRLFWIVNSRVQIVLRLLALGEEAWALALPAWEEEEQATRQAAIS